MDAAGYRSHLQRQLSLLEQLLPQLPVLQQIIYTGSCSIYGDAGGGWADESTTAQPRDEHGAVLLGGRTPVTGQPTNKGGVHPCALGRSMGRNGSSSSACPLLHAQHPTKPRRALHLLVHRDDAAAAAIAALDGHWQGIVNVVDDAPVPLDELLNASLAHSGLEPITWKPSSEPGKPALNRRISNRLLRQRGFELNHQDCPAQWGWRTPARTNIHSRANITTTVTTT